jgi:hypothetical protein
VRACCHFLALFFAASLASASPSARLVYVRAPEATACPGEDVFRKAVATRLGYDPFFPTAQKTVIVRIDRSMKGLAGNLQIVDNDGSLRGERDLGVQGDNCGELVTSLALAVSIAIDDLDERAKDPPAAPEPMVPTQPEPAPAPPTPPRAPAVDLVWMRVNLPDESAFRMHGTIGGGPTLYAGTSDGAALGIALAGTLWATLADTPWNLGLRLEGRAELPVQAQLVGVIPLATSNATATTQLFAAGLSLCASVKLPFACLGASVGRLHSETAGIAAPKQDSIPTFALVARLGAQVPVTRMVYLAPTVEGQLSPLPPSVFINGSKTLSLPMFSGGIAMHLGVHIP